MNTNIDQVEKDDAENDITISPSYCNTGKTEKLRPAQLPAFTPPQGHIHQAPPPAYSAPHTYCYSWVPYQAFPTAPQAEYLYTCDAPPPYPGVDHNMQMYPPPQHKRMNGMSSSDTKAQEAAGCSAYYNPATPHNVYTPAQYPNNPPPYPASAPPAYNDINKKRQ